MASDSGAAKLVGHLGMIGDAVIFRHTLVSLPFALVAVLLETGGRLSIRPLILIVLAAASARNAANAFNRVVDAEIDARNPRTAERHLPTGRLSKRDLLAFAAIMGIILVGSAAMLNWLCVALLPVAAVMIAGYSYTKRFTWLCHFWLGATCAAAPMGAFIALSGRFDSHGARVISALCQFGTLLGLSMAPLSWPKSWAYGTGVAIAAAMLVAEHIVVRGGSARHVRVASYSINEVIPLVVLAATVLDIYVV